MQCYINRPSKFFVLVYWFHSYSLQNWHLLLILGVHSRNSCNLIRVRKYILDISLLNSTFFWNWCNVNPDKITKSNQLWLKEIVSIIHNPFLRVFAIPAFLKVIHAPKTPNFRYPENNLPPYIFSNLHNRDFPLGI